MYAELQQYLLLYKKLTVPGIGTFLLERKPAESDISNRQISAPYYIVKREESEEPHARQFFSWLGSITRLSDREAQMRFEEFSREMKNRLLEGAVINWKGIGEFRRGMENRVDFRGDEFHAEENIPAVKVIRQNALHQVRVGEDIRTSGQMTELLAAKSARRRSGLWIPLILLILAIAFIIWYVVTNGVSGALQYK